MCEPSQWKEQAPMNIPWLSAGPATPGQVTFLETLPTDNMAAVGQAEI